MEHPTTPDVIVLDGHDVPDPEDMAMLQALYSRSPRSVREHLEKVAESGSGKFQEQYYVGYGHKSIGDCGTITICVEGISMLAAKAIQDNPLYNGQEASTRYLDMAGQEQVDPLGTPLAKLVLVTWISIYKQVLAALMTEFEERFPIQEGQKKSVWKKAVKARAFDVARGFLPAGCQTYVAWHTNLRQAHDHLSLMRHNPCMEIREIAYRVHEELTKRYPASFGHKRYETSESYLAAGADRFAYTEGRLEQFRAQPFINWSWLREHFDLMANRPAKTELHQRLRRAGHIEFEFPLDFGSYRDLQRQRSCVQDMPLLTIKHGIHSWYMEQLPVELRAQVQALVADQERRIKELEISPEEKQYYVAMGYVCPIAISCPLPSAVYIAELRSGKTVHPTLRIVAQQMGQELKRLFPEMAMHHDMSQGVWDIKRGEQDIVKKVAVE